MCVIFWYEFVEFIENVPIGILDYIIFIPIWLVYFTYFLGNGQTLGMKVMKLVESNGEYPEGYGKGFLRGIFMIIHISIFCLGYILDLGRRK